MARKLVESRAADVTDQKDRQYFRSVYFFEPGGVLFEIATDMPGFTVDEPQAELGTALKLPPFLEPRRKELEAVLPPLDGQA
jgi:glyoxalase family protein